MIEREIQRKIEDFRQIGIPAYIPRDGQIHVVNHMVSTVVGARRAGKSFRVLQAADDFIRQGFIKSTAQICHVDFDNPILSSTLAKELHLIQQTFLKINPCFDLKTNLVFILDEIHKVSGWEEYVIELSRNPCWRVIVTGSSSKLLREDISTALRGKAVSTTVFPLSFAEYTRFRGFSGKGGSTKGQAEMLRFFDDYLKWGGYPAMPFTAEYSKEVLLREYFDTMMLKDIVQRYDVGKPQQCIHLYNYLLSNISKPFTVKGAYEFLKQGGRATSRDAVSDYIGWGEDSWLFFSVPIHSASAKDQERNYKKIYCIDWAMAIRNSLVWDGYYSRAFENMVYLYLLGKHKRVLYYLTRDKRQEVDFIASDSQGKPVMAVQVCMDVSQPDTLKRELIPLIATARYFGIKENFIITINTEKQIKEDGVTVNMMPAWRWMTE